MSGKRQIDYRGVRRYFAQSGADTAACASYMAHAQDLPENAVRYRFQKERAAIRDWLDVGGPQARVLDLGCGSGTWTEFFAQRFGIVIGIEQSPAMLVAARTKLTDRSNVELLNQDVREPLPPGPFDLVFLGGICMYLNDADTIALVQAVIERLGDRGRVVLRESTVANGYEHGEGEYHVIYRSVDVYRTLFREAGLSRVDTRRNYAYTYMEIAVELVELRRRYLRMLPHTSPFLGALTWWSLRATSPVCFGLLPRTAAWLRVRWPKLQNHFFMLENAS
jgi:trans-aconitate methyltransferase